MNWFQYLKLAVKIVTLLPVVVEGIKAIVTRYKAMDDWDPFRGN